MTVTTEKNRMAAYTTDGVVYEFDFDLEIYEESEIQVWYEPDDENYYQLTLNTDYGVTFGDGVGTVTTDGYTAALPAGKLLLIRHLDILQETDWFNNDSHSELQHQTDFDRGCMVDLQLQEQIDRVVMLAISSSTTGIILPEPEANYLLGWNSSGTNLANISVSAIAVLVADLLGDVLATIPAELTDLTDVTIAAPAAGHMMRNSGTGWENFACPASRIIGRKSAGNVDALSAADARTVLGLDTDDSVTFGAVTAGTLTGTTIVGGSITGTSIKVGDGTVGAPSLTFTSDTDTGFYLDSGPVIAAAIGGVDAFRINASWIEIKDALSANFGTITFAGTAMTAGRTLTLDLNNAARTIDLTGNPTLGDWFNQSVKTTATVTHGTITATGLLTGGSIVTGGLIGLASDPNLLSLANNALTVNGTCTATGAGNFAGLTLNLTQDYLFTNRGGTLAIQGQTDDQVAQYEFYTAKGDSGDDIWWILYAHGVPTDLTGEKSLSIGYDQSEGYWLIGATVDYPITMGTGVNIDQLVLGVDGNNTMSGDLGVTGNVTADDLIITDAHYIGSATTPGAIQIEADGDVVLSNNLFIPSAFYHVGDGDTGFIFPNNNQLNLQAGGSEFLACNFAALPVDKIPNELVGNDGGVDIDFRYEGTGNANLLFCDAANDRVAVGSNAPSVLFSVFGVSRLGDDTTNYSSFSATGDQTFVGSAGFYPRFLTQAAEPATGTGATQCDTSEMVVWKDSDDSKVYLCFNDGGTVKTVELA